MADFSSISLTKLLKSFEDTAVYDEALKETFTKDLNLNNLLDVIGKIRKKEIEVVKLETLGESSPLARLGIERVHMKTDLIPAGRMRSIITESAKARLLNEVRSFICTQCWDYLEMIRIKNLPERPLCPRCGSSSLGLLRTDEESARPLIEKKGESLTKSEQKLHDSASKTATYIAKYGKTAAIVLSAHRVRTNEAKNILKQEKTYSDHFFELVVEAERKALRRRFMAD